MCEINLTEKIEILIRFSEVDAMNVVWHGNYLKYFEDGRESFGKKYGIHYMDFIKAEIFVPLVNIELNFKKAINYNERVIVETRYIDCEAAKLKFEYTLYKSSNNEVSATGCSTQVFLNKNMELLLTFPEFFIEWKKKWLKK